MTPNLLENKKILIVDDEIDVLKTLSEILVMCKIECASNFEDALYKINNGIFDLIILDIMGVNGYCLLEKAIEKEITTVILTANALSIEDTVKSFKKGAASYIPKEKMKDIDIFLIDILEAKELGKNPLWRWLTRFQSYYEKKFGQEWKDNDPEFWKRFGYWI